MKSRSKPDQKEAKKELTVKERRFIKFFIEGGNVGGKTVQPGNATQAARAAGYISKTDDGLRTVASQVLKRLALPIKDLMDECGLDDLHLLQKLHMGLRAWVTKTASFEGEITDQIDMIDFETRSRYLDIAFKVKGSYAAEKQEHRFPDGIPVREMSAHERDVLKKVASSALRKAHG